MSREQKSPLDSFRVLALMAVAVGLLIVVGGSVIWYLTGRTSSLILGAGLTLASGGGLREFVEKSSRSLASRKLEETTEKYAPPPPRLPSIDELEQHHREMRHDR